MANLKQHFTNLYQVTKTLRFELKPIGNTAEHIKKDKVLEQDNKKADSYQKLKPIIDDFHREFMENSLKGINLDWSDLEEKIKAIKSIKLNRKDKDNEKKKKNKENLEKELENLQATYRKNIINYLINNTKYTLKNITNANLIKEILPSWIKDQDWIKDEECKPLLDEFKNFDGYFSNFHKNRENIYSDKAQTTAFAHRIVHENFDKFLINSNFYTKNLSKYNIFEDIDIVKDESIKKFPRFENNTKEQVITELKTIFNGGINYFNNVIIQSGIEKYNDYIGVYNLINNLYKQQHNLNNNDSPNLKDLLKQILAKSNKGDYIKKLANDGEVIDSINNYQQNLREKNTIQHIKDLLQNFSNYELNKIYLINDKLNEVSKQLFDDWEIIRDALFFYYKEKYPEKKTKKYEKDKAKWFKQDFSLGFLQEQVDNYCKENGKASKNITDYFINKINSLTIDDKEYKKTVESYKNSGKQKLIKASAKNDVETIKKLLDKYQSLLWIIKPLMINQKNKDKENKIIVKDESFYTDLEKYYLEILEITHLYNLVRNYITQKPFSHAKIKLNFNQPHLLDGFVESNTEKSKNGTQYGGYLFRKYNPRFKIYEYFLGISKNKKLFNVDNKINNNDRSEFERLNYYQAKVTSIYGTSYKSIVGSEYKKHKKSLINLIHNFLLDHDIQNNKLLNYKNGNNATPIGYFSVIKENNEELFNNIKQDKNIRELELKIVNNLKNVIESYKNKFSIKNILEKKYKNLENIIKDIDDLCKNKFFVYQNIGQSTYSSAIQSGEKKLYMFRLHNKDLSYSDNRDKTKRGKSNLHTLYFQALMSQENTIFDLGKGEVFYRKSSIKKYITHPKNQAIINKTKQAKNKKSIFAYDIIKNKRYSEDKYFFHLSIDINFKEKKEFNLNQNINDFLKNNPDVNIIGIDRGEKNLAYYSVINQKGEILAQASFNKINGFDYHKKLDELEKGRDAARKNWQSIAKIKDLKAGYISQVVHKITQLMVEHNAIVVMEDLNMGMKRGRQKIEKQVYQHLEKALIEKLNYLSFKDYANDKAGSIRYGLQLTNKFDSFDKMGKQTGFIFYVEPSYTSKIDFATGFVPFKYFKYENINKAEQLLSAIDNIMQKNDAFIVDIDYKGFSGQTKWSIYLDTQERYQYMKNNNGNFENTQINVYEVLKECFDQNNIDLNNIKPSIIGSKNKKVYTTLFKYLNLVSQMRFNSESEDYILSPVKDKNHKFFRTNLESDILPKDSDANGAYHIALKGLWTLHHKINKDQKDLYITKNEWFEYAQDIASKR